MQIAFLPQEQIALADADEHGHPYNQRIFNREELLRLLASRTPSTGAGGAYVMVNPTDGKGFTASHLTAARHLLVDIASLTPTAIDDERDERDTNSAGVVPLQRRPEVLRLIATGIPTIAITDAADGLGSTTQALIAVDAPDLATYRRSADVTQKILAANGLHPSTHSLTAATWGRQPGALRDGRVQQLIALGLGVAPSFKKWVQWVFAHSV